MFCLCICSYVQPKCPCGRGAGYSGPHVPCLALLGPTLQLKLRVVRVWGAVVLLVDFVAQTLLGWVQVSNEPTGWDRCDSIHSLWGPGLPTAKQMVQQVCGSV